MKLNHFLLHEFPYLIDYLKLKHTENKSLISYVSGLNTTKIDYGKIQDPDLKYGFNPGILARLVLLEAPVPTKQDSLS